MAESPVPTMILVSTVDVIYDCWFEDKILVIRRVRVADQRVTEYRLFEEAQRLLYALLDERYKGTAQVRLIAAAPKMLDALKEYSQLLAFGGAVTEWNKLRDKATALVAQVEGR